MAVASPVRSISSLSLPSLIHSYDTDTDTDTDKNTDSDSDIENFEEVELDITYYDRDMPARPASRLGFNRALIQGQRQLDGKSIQIEKTAHLHLAVSPRWTRGLFQKPNTQVLAIPPDTIADTTETGRPPDPTGPPSSSSSIAEAGSDSLSFNSTCTSDEENTTFDGFSNSAVLHFPTPPCPSPPIPQLKPPTRRPVPFPILRSAQPSSEYPREPVAKHSRSPPPLFAAAAQARQKFSCLPSPFSPVSSSPRSRPLSPFFAQNEAHTLHAQPHPTPLRHNYANHGHSRNALLQLKYFWNARYGEWVGYAYECALFSESSGPRTKTDIFEDEDAYDGMANSPPGMAHSGSQPAPRFPPAPPSRLPANNTTPAPTATPVPLTIHPRTGDISALRDPYCMHIDVCFAGLPLWTLGKTLWMFEVHRLDAGMCAKGDEEIQNAEDGKDREAGAEEARGVGQDSDIEMTRSTSAGFSEASDVTLVEDGPTVLASPVSEPEKEESIMEIDVDMDMDVDMSMIQDDDGLFEKYLLEDIDLGDTGAKETHQIPHPKPAVSNEHAAPTQQPTCTQPWQLTWYARWELLVELVRRDQARGHGIIPGAAPGKDKAAKRMFYLGDDEDEDEEGRMEVDEDGEEDDYGVLVANPVYPPSRVFDTGSRG